MNRSKVEGLSMESRPKSDLAPFFPGAARDAIRERLSYRWLRI